MEALELLDWVIAVVVVLAVLWGTTRQPVPPDSTLCEKNPADEEAPEEKKT